jgi:hypothetical protein
MQRTLGRGVLAAALVLGVTGLTATMTTSAASAAPGDASMTIKVGDDVAGGQYEIDFVKAYGGTTPDGTPVYVYAPKGWDVNGGAGVLGLDPNVDPKAGDAYTPCGGAVADHTLSPAKIKALGDELAGHVVAVDEEHFGPIGDANGTEPGGDALVTLVYNVFDDAYYDCAEDSYTAGYYAPAFKEDYGMNVIVIDSNDFEGMTGHPTEGADLTNEGVIAHELQHLVHDYADANEVSWVNEGLADFAMFLNGYPTGGSHITYDQVFHRETSLTRWAGGLENYGASYTFFQYLWERAGGNGEGVPAAQQYRPDSLNNHVNGDLAIQTIFREQANGMDGVARGIASYNAANPGTKYDLPSVDELFKDWSLAIYLDDETDSAYDVKALDIGSIDSQGWTIDIANDEFWKNRGQYTGNTPEGFFQHAPRVPAQSALPFGTSYETFKNVGKTFKLEFDGPANVSIIPGNTDKFWFGGTESQSDHVLDGGQVTAGQTVSFDTWYFVEEGWDYGFVEALVNGSWVTVPVTDAAGKVLTTNTNPQGNNTEGNGLTGTSGGAYFVDEPKLLTGVKAVMPAGASQVRFRYSTDAAYVDTGWFVKNVAVGGVARTPTSAPDNWAYVMPEQANDWSVQVVSPCDLTPGTTIAGESSEPGRYVYRLKGAHIAQSFSQCSTKDSFTVVISNLTGGALDSLDAGYRFRVTNTAAKGK